MSAAQITSLLTNRDLDRISRLRLNAKRRFTNRARGEHLAGKGGASTEFCDYRDYTPGDDMRHVDWNIFARMNRPYLKQFHREEELHTAVLVDGSDSMLFENKWETALQLAATFGAIALRSGEKLSACRVGGDLPVPRLAPCGGRASLGKLFGFLENLPAGGMSPLEQGIEHFLRQHRGRGVVVVISDFLTGGDLQRAFHRLHSAGLETFALQILGPSEVDPGLNGDLRLVDAETTETLDITSAGDLLTLYHEYRARHAARIDELSRRGGGRFFTTHTAEPWDRLIFDHLRRRGWLV